MKILGAKDFSGQSLQLKGDWSVCFGADWCPFCRAFRAKYEALDGKVGFSVAWGDVTDMDTPLWETFGLDVVPTVIAYRDGKALWRKDGAAGVGLDENAIRGLKKAFKR
jgi:thiol-disulfide isomerase/thioredoxin